MPNKTEHVQFGAFAGTGYSLIAAQVSGRTPSIFELIGCAVGSILASMGPDVLEPAHNPNHRSTCHSVVVLGALLFIAQPKLEVERQRRLLLAESYRQQAQTCSGDHRSYWLGQVQGQEFLAGFFSGLVPGYASHVIADSQTPKGIPLV